jgi:hypothetical protein
VNTNYFDAFLRNASLKFSSPFLYSESQGPTPTTLFVEIFPPQCHNKIYTNVDGPVSARRMRYTKGAKQKQYRKGHAAQKRCPRHF